MTKFNKLKTTQRKIAQFCSLLNVTQSSMKSKSIGEQCLIPT